MGDSEGTTALLQHRGALSKWSEEMPAMISLPHLKVNLHVLAKQHLLRGARENDIVRIAGDVFGLHATCPSTPYISLLARSPDFNRKMLDRQLFDERTLGRIRCMRKTVHILSKDMLPVAFGATRELLERSSCRYFGHFGIDEDEYRRISGKIRSVLAGRMLDMRELKREIPGIKHLSLMVNRLCDACVLVRGPGKTWKSTSYRYGIFDELYPDVEMNVPDGERALMHLLERYIKAYGPVSETDICWWCGLGKGKVRKALGEIMGEIETVEIDGLPGAYLIFKEHVQDVLNADRPGDATVNILPVLDPYLMGYKDRGRYVDEERYHFVFDRSGNGTSTILVDGKVAGVWDLSKKDRRVKLFLFGEMQGTVMRTVVEEAERTGTFVMDERVEAVICEEMTPLTDRTAGGFMSPLRES